MYFQSGQFWWSNVDSSEFATLKALELAADLVIGK